MTPERWSLWPLRCSIAPWRENARLRRWISSIGESHFESLRAWNDSRLSMEEIIRQRLPLASDAYGDLKKAISEQTKEQAKLTQLARRQFLLAQKPKRLKK